MKIKVSELEGEALDWAVAKCEGVAVEITSVADILERRLLSLTPEEAAGLKRPVPYCTIPGVGQAAYSTNWGQFGPIREREFISIMIDEWDVEGTPIVKSWCARTLANEIEGNDVFESGPTALIAGVRCYVASTLGQEIDVPDALLDLQDIPVVHHNPDQVQTAKPTRQDETFEVRAAALPRLQQTAGAAYTFYQAASKALQGALGDARGVDWDLVHRYVFAKAVGQDKQPVAQVLDAIKLHSPGAVTPEQIAAVEALSESRKLEAKRIVAVFQPQAWVNDDATDIDGQEEVDVTYRVLNMTLDRIHVLQDHRDSTDDLVDGSMVAIEHDGPFTVRAVDSVCEFFGVDEISNITEGMLQSARKQMLVQDYKGRAVPLSNEISDELRQQIRKNADYGDRPEYALSTEEVLALHHSVTAGLATTNGDSGVCTVSTRQLALLLDAAAQNAVLNPEKPLAILQAAVERIAQGGVEYSTSPHELRAMAKAALKDAGLVRVRSAVNSRDDGPSP